VREFANQIVGCCDQIQTGQPVRRRSERGRARPSAVRGCQSKKAPLERGLYGYSGPTALKKSRSRELWCRRKKPDDIAFIVDPIDECALNAEGHCLLRTWGIEHLEGASVSEETVHVPTRVDKSTDDFTFVIAAESLFAT
jgi:hypothetical protein